MMKKYTGTEKLHNNEDMKPYDNPSFRMKLEHI